MAQILPDSLLERAVERYEKALTALETAAEDLSIEHILDVLIARDTVQVAMSDKTQHHSSRLIKAVKELDLRLKQQAKYINRVARVGEWQAIFNPPEKEWWWLLDPITPKPWRDRFDWLWRFFSLVFLTASFSLLIDISQKFLSAGADTAGVFAIIIPSVLTLLAGGGALTKPGQEGIEYILTSLKLEKAWWDEIICVASGLLFVLLLIFHVSLPSIGDSYYINVADKAYKAGQLTIAEENYNRTLKLNPDNKEAHYKLGKIYEELQDFERAIENYKIAWKHKHPNALDDIASLYLNQKNYAQADSWLRKAVDSLKSNKKNYTISNKQYLMLQTLSRAYIEQKKYSEAIYWLTLGLNAAENGGKNKKEQQYNMLKFLGWVRLKQERSEAKDFLDQAIKLNRGKAPAHCLLAQVLDQQKDNKGALHWEQCLGLASLKDPDEDTWIGLARTRLKAIGDR